MLKSMGGDYMKDVAVGRKGRDSLVRVQGLEYILGCGLVPVDVVLYTVSNIWLETRPQRPPFPDGARPCGVGVDTSHATLAGCVPRLLVSHILSIPTGPTRRAITWANSHSGNPPFTTRNLSPRPSSKASEIFSRSCLSANMVQAELYAQAYLDGDPDIH